MSDEVEMIPIEQIRIINPRHREKKKFELVVDSIRRVGLKKPIQVSRRAPDEEGGPGYDLVCGQGRIEALVALGHKEIPAMVVEIAREDRLLRSLVENMARRLASPQALMVEIERLKGEGYTNVAIAEKLGVADTVVGGYLALNKAGEERLMDAALRGQIPLTVAMDIARSESPEMQRGLLKAYESKQLNGVSIREVKRIMDQRRFLGKHRGANPRERKKLTSAESLINTYRRQSEQQKLLIKKARLCEAKLVFTVTAFKRLLSDEHFVTLLKAEGLTQMPKDLYERLGTATGG